ncbi:MAG: hypothetical protein J5666_03855, partial [Bacilli bacterium]|nr:hypothetical protein [Bacilli bacterium]
YISFYSIKFRYLSDLDFNKPLIGVCRFVKYDDGFNVDYPNKIDEDINIAISGYKKELSNLFEYVLLKRGLYFEEASKIVEEYGKVDYELRYVSHGKVIDVIKNQHFDMLEDDDIDSSLLVGAKIGDFVTLEKGDVTIGAVIQNVTNRYPYNEDDYDIDVMGPIFSHLNIDSFEKLRKAFYKEYFIKVTRDVYFDDAISQMVEEIDYDVSDEVLKFFENYDAAPFYDELNSEKDEEDKKEVVKKILLYYSLVDSSYSTLKIDYNLHEQIEKNLMAVTIDGNYKMKDIIFEAGKIDILDRLKEMNVENIIKEYK